MILLTALLPMMIPRAEAVVTEPVRVPVLSVPLNQGCEGVPESGDTSRCEGYSSESLGGAHEVGSCRPLDAKIMNYGKDGTGGTG